MVIYNITLKIDLDTHESVVDWIVATQLEMENDQFTSPPKLFRLLDVDVTDGITYCLQYYFTDISSYNLHRADADYVFRENLSGLFTDKFVIFSSILSEV